MESTKVLIFGMDGIGNRHPHEKRRKWKSGRESMWVHGGEVRYYCGPRTCYSEFAAMVQKNLKKYGVAVDQMFLGHRDSVPSQHQPQEDGLCKQARNIVKSNDLEFLINEAIKLLTKLGDNVESLSFIACSAHDEIIPPSHLCAKGPDSQHGWHRKIDNPRQESPEEDATSQHCRCSIDASIT